VDELVRGVQGGLAAFLYTIGMFLAVFASAGLISAIFEPGRIELLLSKPVARLHILLGRYLGNLLVIAVNLLYLVLGVWVVFGVKVGIWRVGFLWSAAFSLLIFSVLLTVILLMGVLWESTAVTVLGTFGVMILASVVSTHSQLIKLLSSETSRNVVRVLYYVLPKPVDIGRIASDVSRGNPVGDWMPVWSTALFGIAILSLSVYLFQRKNF
jgi:ABC-type transport system involved in multi-copper enzyme maturation permease subunit